MLKSRVSAGVFLWRPQLRGITPQRNNNKISIN